MARFPSNILNFRRTEAFLSLLFVKAHNSQYWSHLAAVPTTGFSSAVTEKKREFLCTEVKYLSDARKNLNMCGIAVDHKSSGKTDLCGTRGESLAKMLRNERFFSLPFENGVNVFSLSKVYPVILLNHYLRIVSKDKFQINWFLFGYFYSITDILFYVDRQKTFFFTDVGVQLILFCIPIKRTYKFSYVVFAGI